MKIFLKLISIIFFFCCSLDLHAQVKLSSVLSATEINKDENTTYRIILENAEDIQSISPPNFKDLILISGPFQESGKQSFNGVSTSYLILSFVIKTKGTGKFRIPGAVAKINGKIYKSNAVELVVKNSRASNPGSVSGSKGIAGPAPYYDSRAPETSFSDYIFKNGENVPEKVSRNMHLRLEVNKTSCYVGEPVVATYKLYTRLKSESRLTQNPSFNGFSVIDLQAPDITASSVDKLNGREFNVYTIRKAQLYPLQDGIIELESAELENRVKFIRDSYLKNNSGNISDLFDEFASASVPPEAEINQTVTLSSKPVSITVKPLPETGKPASFKGAVGNFSIEAAIDKSTFSTDQSGKFVVSISGSGNLQLVTSPVISWPKGIQSFDIKSTDNLNSSTVPVSGYKDFSYTISADSPGDYIIPEIEFSFFDPSKDAYEVLKTRAVRFSVNKGTGVPQLVFANQKVKEVTLYDQVFKNRKWLVLIIMVLGFSGLLIYLKRDKKKNAQIPEALPEESKMDAIIKASSYNQLNPLEKTEKCLYDPECNTFYSVLNAEVKECLSHKLSIPADQLNNEILPEQMDKANFSNETVLKLQKLLQEIEWQLYTPFERDEKMENLYHRAHSLLMHINCEENYTSVNL